MDQQRCFANLREHTLLLTDMGSEHRWESMLVLLQQMLIHGPQPDRVSCGAAVSVCEKATQWTWALSLLANLVQWRMPVDARSYVSAASSCGRAHHWIRAYQLFSAMWRLHLGGDERSYNVAMSAFARAALWSRAIQLLDDMGRVVLVPGTLTRTSAISACEKSSQWEVALGLFSRVQRPDIVCISSVVSACEKGTQWRRAIHILSQVREHHLQVNAVACSAAMAACGKAGKWRHALFLVEDMRRSDLQADNPYCVSVVSACERGTQWLLALKFMQEFCVNAMHPGLKGYSAAISACEKGHFWEAALWFLHVMRQGLLTPNSFSYNAALNSLEHGACWRKSLELFVAARELDIIGAAAIYYVWERCQQFKKLQSLAIYMTRHMRQPHRKERLPTGFQRFVGELVVENSLLDIFDLPRTTNLRLFWKYLCKPVQHQLLLSLARENTQRRDQQSRSAPCLSDVLDLGSRASKDLLRFLSILDLKCHRPRTKASNSWPCTMHLGRLSSPIQASHAVVPLPGKPLAKALFVSIHCCLRPGGRFQNSWRLLWAAEVRTVA